MDPSGMDGISTKRLDYLPIIGQALRRLGVRDLVDGLVPRDPRSHVSTGECVEALIVAILHGKHTLYRINELLARYDLELAFGWTGGEEHFHDDRLGRALAETFEAGLMKLQTAAIMRAVQAHELDLRHLHLDTSSVSFYGQYLNGCAPEDPEDPQAIPFVTRGHSKDYRGDLKQVIYGLAVSGDGGVPIFGRFTSGNRSDSEETRWLLKSLAEALPDPHGATLVGDSKFFSGETLLAARSSGFHVMTMLPRNVSVWGEAYTAFRGALAADGPMETLKVVYPETFEGGVAVADTSAEPLKEWRGCSFDLNYRWTDETTKQEHELPLRALVVESTTLRDQKIDIVHARRDKESKALAAVVAKYATREFQCEGDALAAVPKIIKKHGPDLHRLKTSVVAELVPVKRPGPGRPCADEERPTRLVWRVVIEVEHDPHDVEEAILRESCFVLVTTCPREGPGASTDNELFRRYQEQNHVEAAFRTFKNPLEVAPVFTQSESSSDEVGESPGAPPRGSSSVVQEAGQADLLTGDLVVRRTACMGRQRRSGRPARPSRGLLEQGRGGVDGGQEAAREATSESVAAARGRVVSRWRGSRRRKGGRALAVIVVVVGRAVEVVVTRSLCVPSASVHEPRGPNPYLGHPGGRRWAKGRFGSRTLSGRSRTGVGEGVRGLGGRRSRRICGSTRSRWPAPTA